MPTLPLTSVVASPAQPALRLRVRAAVQQRILTRQAAYGQGRQAYRPATTNSHERSRSFVGRTFPASPIRATVSHLFHPMRWMTALVRSPMDSAQAERWCNTRTRGIPRDLSATHAFLGTQTAAAETVPAHASTLRKPHRGRKFRRVTNPSEYVLPQPTDDPETALVRATLATMPAELREAYVMCVVDDLDPEDAAAELDITLRMVVRRLADAQRIIAAALTARAKCN